MKKSITWLLLSIVTGLFIACSSTQPMSDSTMLFIQETRLSLITPLRFYTWIKVENAKRVQNDIFNGLLDFEYDGSGDFLLKTVTQNNKIISVWGNQILLQNEESRQLIFTPFI
jgi:hypothetical protein